MISPDYRVYMGSSITVSSLRRLLLYLCSYKLDSSVTGILYDIALYVGLFEILCDFIGLSGLYGLKYDGLIALVIAIVLVLL